MFRGIANLSVDAKGRVAIPKMHRDRMDAEGNRDLVLTIDPDYCLLLYPADVFRVLAKQIMELPNTDPYNRGLQRTYVGHAIDVDIDGNGRILIPATLRDYAGIERKAVMLGQGNKLELWSEENWESRFSSYPSMLNDTPREGLSEAVRNLSI